MAGFVVVDSFASGLQFGFLEFNNAPKAAEYGAAHLLSP
jgi:2-dehydro-3-deoxygluconokinase